jgi:HTH-type transcriptional regulator / antitoxin HigA
MNIRPIRTARDHRAALKTVESLMGSPRNTPEGERPLTLDMIWKLHRGLGIPADSLIKQPAPRAGD